MLKFIRQGNVFKPFYDEAVDIQNNLPAGNYIIEQDMFKNFYLSTLSSFELPPKLYGNTKKTAKRILSTFNDREASTGVLLSGDKGAGKTLLAKVISSMAAELGIPTITINQNWAGHELGKFIQDISQPCIIMFDEFEKVYKYDEQESILTVLDGVFTSKKLFLLTCNNKYGIHEYMLNRPGRIFYFIEYKGLESSFVEEYCQDNLKDKTHIKSVEMVSTTFESFNFDILKALVEEMNRYDESPFDAMKMLNATPIRDKSEFSLELFVGGAPITENIDCYGRGCTYRGNPLVAKEIELLHYSDDGNEPGKYKFMHSHLTKLDLTQQKYTYVNGDTVLILTKIRAEETNFADFFERYAV